MTNTQYKCPPILLLIFNRPDTTAVVFESIRNARPSKLYIAADGARLYRTGEIEQCMKTREIVSHVDWDCEVHTLFRDINLGCACAVREAIDWFFSYENSGIIIEDDCVPSQSFYPFCGRMLEEYSDNSDVFMISGYAPYSDNIISEYQYHFSRWANIWGWATWKNKWELYDLSFPNWGEYKKEFLNDPYFNNMKEFREWFVYIFDENKLCSDSTAWSWAWTYTLFSHNGLCLTPNRNLISNIGNVGGHYNAESSPLLNTDVSEFEVESLVLRGDIFADKEIDEIRIRQYMDSLGIPTQIIWNMSWVLRKFGFFKRGNKCHPMSLCLKIKSLLCR